MFKKTVLNLQLFAQEPEAAPQETQPSQEETRQEAEPQKIADGRFTEHFRELERQSEKLQAKYPGFRLREELNNPLFVRLTAPGMGVSVEDAYHAVHHRELQKAAVQAAQQQLSRSIASGGRRPQENGLSGQAAAVSTFDYRSASKEQREDLKRRIRLAAAEGRKLYPGRG